MDNRVLRGGRKRAQKSLDVYVVGETAHDLDSWVIICVHVRVCLCARTVNHALQKPSVHSAQKLHCTSSDHLNIWHIRNSLHKKGCQSAVWRNFLQRVTSAKYQLCPLFVNSAQIHVGVASEKWKLLVKPDWLYEKYWYRLKANEIALLLV